MQSVKDITVKQLGQDLHLSWQTNDSVQLTRDGTTLVTGAVQQYVDSNLVPLAPVQYELETGEEFLTIDTALVLDEGQLFWNQKSTIIIRSDQELLIRWGAIPDVESYSVFRDGKRLGETAEHE